SLLNTAEQALFRGDQGALPVDVDSPAFENYAGALMLWLNGSGAGGLCHERPNFFVVPIVRILGPSVEAPVKGMEGCRASLGTTGEGARRSTDNERAATVAGPHAVGRPPMEADVLIQRIREL